MEKRIDINAIEKEWTDFVNSKKFNVNEFAYNVQPMIAELKRSYKEIDSLTATLTGWQGDVPYVEDCEDCGAHDGAQTEGCDSCGIIHYQTSKGLRDLYGYTWGFFHKDSPKWTEFQ